MVFDNWHQIFSAANLAIPNFAMHQAPGPPAVFLDEVAQYHSIFSRRQHIEKFFWPQYVNSKLSEQNQGHWNVSGRSALHGNFCTFVL